MTRTSASLAAAIAGALSSVAAFGAAPVPDLTTRLLSDNPSWIRSAAKEVHRAGQADQATLDLMAEVLARNATQQDKYFVDAGAWLCLALGAAGGPRYFEVMQAVANNDAADSKVADHCEEASEDWSSAMASQYRAGTIDLALRKAQSPASASALAELNVDARQRLLSADYRNVRTGAKTIFANKGADRQTLDVMAEVLLQTAPLPDDDGFRTDAGAWMCLAFGQADDRRYLQALQQVATNPSAPDKITDACEDVVDDWEATGAEQYQRGSLDLALLRAEARKQAEAAPPVVAAAPASARAPAPVVVAAAAPVAALVPAQVALGASPPPPRETAPPTQVVLVLGLPGVPADEPLSYGHGIPQPIAGGHGAFSSPFTEDGTVAPWIAKAMTVKAGSALGSSVGGYAGQYAADKAMEQAGAFVPGLSLLGNMFGKKAGEAVGRKAAIEAAGGWDYIKGTSDISFRSVHDLARFIVLRNQAHPDFMKVVETASSVYPDLQQAVFSNLR